MSITALFPQSTNEDARGEASADDGAKAVQIDQLKSKMID
jgi:hypothetical protein